MKQDCGLARYGDKPEQDGHKFGKLSEQERRTAEGGKGEGEEGDGEEGELELKEGQQIGGVVVQAPKTGRDAQPAVLGCERCEPAGVMLGIVYAVPPGQISNNMPGSLSELKKLKLEYNN